MIYFDNAATTYPKPLEVIRAVSQSLRFHGNPGRGAHRLSMAAAEEIYACRAAAAELFGAKTERVIFTSGATHSLNIAINAAREREGAILISDLEHNAVLRPATATGKDVRIFDTAPSLMGEERTLAILASIDSLSHGASTLVATAASNICGATLPIAEIGRYCRSRGILFIVDGAQAGGIYDINTERDFIDALCLPSHKGLYGPMGAGLMILGEDVTLPSFMYGGSGINSADPVMPDLPPEKYEAGTLAVPIIAGLRRGIEFVNSQKPKKLRAHSATLSAMLTERLLSLGVHVYAPEHIGGCVLFKIDGRDHEDIASELGSVGICTRAGLHCAPLAHRTLGSDGAVRVSFGAFNTEAEVVELCRKISRMV